MDSRKPPIPPVPEPFASAEEFLAAFARDSGGLVSYVDSRERVLFCTRRLAAFFGSTPEGLADPICWRIWPNTNPTRNVPRLYRNAANSAALFKSRPLSSKAQMMTPTNNNNKGHSKKRRRARSVDGNEISVL